MKKEILYCLLIFLSVRINAQQAFTNYGNLQVHNGGSVSGFGNFSNTSTGTFVNNGSMYVRGTLTNDQASMAAGTGTLYLNGTSSQTVNGSQVFRTYNLETNNAAGIVLNNSLSASGLHTFSSGLITTSVTPDYMMYEAGSSHTGSSDARHVNGWVKKTGNTAFTFPVGDGTYLRSIAISTLSASSEFNAHYYTPTPNPLNLASPLVQVKYNEYWQLNRVSGGTAQVTLNWDHSKVAMDNIPIADIVVAYYTGGNWTDDGGSASGNVTTTGSVTSNVINAFGSFTPGYRSFPVPLKLISFAAVRQPGKTLVKWETENEESVDHFEVQRSFDGINFTIAGSVAARNLASQQVYNFEDIISLQGIAYYRLRSVDIDGGFSYSKIVVVSEADFRSSSFAVLNPARSAITVFNKTGNDGTFGYNIYNPGGQLVAKGSVSMTVNGGAVLPLPSAVASGIYVLEIFNEQIRYVQKIAVEK